MCHMMWHMRTTIELDDELVAALMARHPGIPRTEAIEIALHEYVEGGAARRLRELAGTVQVDDVSSELRHIDRKG